MPADLYRAGADAASDLLREVYQVEKALDPLNPVDFLEISRRLARSLQGATRDEEARALRRSLRTLDVDWANLGGAQRDQVFEAARGAFAHIPNRALPALDDVFGGEIDGLVASAREATDRAFGLGIGSRLGALDVRASAFLRKSQASFIRAEYGRRAEALSQRARDLVAEGLEAGLGRDDIADSLEEGLSMSAVARGRQYWQMTAGVFVSRARSYAQVSAYRDAGIDRYVVSAVLDETTSNVCRFLDGKPLSVGGAVAQLDRVEALDDPEDIRSEQPFVREGETDGERFLFVKRGEDRTLLARVVESGVGVADARGRYSDEHSDLEAAGIGPPPYHGHCRSTTVPG
jgi:hypothetical protein